MPSLSNKRNTSVRSLNAPISTRPSPIVALPTPYSGAPAGATSTCVPSASSTSTDPKASGSPCHDRLWSASTIAAAGRAQSDGIRMIGGAMPESAAFRDRVRADLVALAAGGDLVVPMARTFPLADARAALDLLRSGQPGGKLALLP